MKKGVIFWLTFTLSLLAMTALKGTSSQSITVLPGPVKVKQGNNVTLWCKLEGDSNVSKNRPPVTWQSPPNFDSRTRNCTSFMKEKYDISCGEGRWYNMTIVDVQWSDKGEYRCISNIKKIVELQVLVPVTKMSLTRIPRSKKELLLLGKESNAALTCTTNCAYPASDISWFENDQPSNVSAGVAFRECTGEKKGLKQTISIVTVNGRDEGEDRTQSNISCTAGGSVKGESKVSRVVNVRYNVPVSKVTLTHIPRSKEELLLLGKDGFAVLTCSTNCAYPAPSISWFKNGQPFNDSLEVTITECTEVKKFQKRTISMVTVNGKYVDVERNQSISCTAGNVEGEPKVSRMVNVKFNEIAKPTQPQPTQPQPTPVMSAGATAAAIVVPVLVIAVSIIIIIMVVRKYRKKGKDEKELNIPLLQCGGGCRIIYAYEDTKASDEEGKAFLEALRKGLQKHGFKVELRIVKRSRGRLVNKVVEELESKSKKVILSFPADKFGEDELHKTFKEIMQGGEKPFVAVIIQTEAFMALPSELQRIEELWIEKKGETQGFGRAKYHLHFLQDETTKQVDVTLMNLGTGLAWSYYLGYLTFLLSVFKKTLLTSAWQNENPDIPGNRISKQIHIVFSTDCQEPKIMSSDERIKLKRKIGHPIDRAGLKRNYPLKIQEVQSKDRKESYYGVVCFLNVVQCLSEMESDTNTKFFLCDKDDVRTHGQDCFEKLKLIIKYNEKIKEDQSKFDFIKFNAEAANADENDLVDDLFKRMKEACLLDTRRPIREAPATDVYKTGVLSDPSEDVKQFVDDLENAIWITNCSNVHCRSEFGLNIIRESKRIFMVLTDNFVISSDFAKWFYMILEKGFQRNNKRFLVCLNCLKENVNYPKVLELGQLFDCVCYTPKWTDVVKRELEGDVEEIRYDHLSHNIGTGLAMSWYYKFLKIKIPKVRDVIEKCPVLRKKFQEGRMSHKVFILFPSSCCCPKKVPCVDIIEEVDSKKINLPQIKNKKDNRDYSPTVYSLNDEGEEYYAFVEYSAPADTMYQMKGFLKMPEKILQEEWDRFRSTLHTLINHKYEPMDIKNRVFFIPYDDTKLKGQALEFMLLDHVKSQLPPKTERKLPESIDNGATIELRSEETPETEPVAATVGDTSASGGAKADATANTTGVV